MNYGRKTMKIPLLWRLEKYMNVKKEDGVVQELKNPFVKKHTKIYYCKGCQVETKHAVRKNSRKCLKCGFKVYF